MGSHTDNQLSRLRLSARGHMILREILRQPGHFTAEDLVRWAMDGPDRVSRATVYRVLGRLLEEGVVDEVRLGHPEAVYEYTGRRDHHDHLVCVVCGAVQELASPELEAAKEKACKDAGFVPEGHHFVVYGACSACR
ncbi:MAG: transcriptional repressor [Victivallales bacterium]|jgi:Fur family transcriptional regulator, ferric uptake regulator|nr:transcriptional repressor [Victivallales bacterium]MBT7164780.1 transcriptional repressor [Victivallales bacterium]MBT7303364.1 transcriptional repressor [Victivallales bacterium]